MLEALNILEGYDLGKMGSRSADSMHVTAEAFRRAFYDRAEFLGDPDFAQLPVAQLIDKKYAYGMAGLNGHAARHRQQRHASAIRVRPT